MVTDRRTMLALLLLATGWTDSVMTAPATTPRLALQFGGEGGMSGLDVQVNGKTFSFSPEEIEQSLDNVSVRVK